MACVVERAAEQIGSGRARFYLLDSCIERNALWANLVARAEDWLWSSLRSWVNPPLLPFVESGPVSRGADWVVQVKTLQTEAELLRLRQSVNRGTPYGTEDC